MVLLALTVGLLTLIISLVYFYWTKNYDYWRKKGIDFIPPSFPFGNIKPILFSQRTMGELYREFYRQSMSSKVVGFFKLRTPILMVKSPELVKAVLSEKFRYFDANDFHFSEESDPVLANNPFVVSGERWTYVRSIIGTAQSPMKLKTLVPCSEMVAKNMIDFIERNVNKPLEMTELMGHVTTDVTSAWGLGIKTDSFNNPKSEIRSVVTNIFGGDFSSNLAILLAFYAPSIGSILKLRMLQKKFVNFLGGLMEEILKGRQDSTESRNDFIQILLDMNKEAKKKGKPEMDKQEIMGHATTFFSEGYLTSSLTLSYTLHELASHPEIQDQARAHVRSLVETVSQLDYAKLNQLDYLEYIINESLRLHPPVPVMTRVCGQNGTTLPGIDLTVDKGTPVVIPVYALHMDPKVFPEPQLFRPDRFNPAELTPEQKYLFLGFSQGPRSCIGLRIALLNIKVILAAILLNFKIVKNDKTSPIEYDQSSSFVFLPKGGIWLSFEPIS